MSKDISKISSPIDSDKLSINTIRFLAIDAIQKANSGHPGLPMKNQSICTSAEAISNICLWMNHVFPSNRLMHW